MNKEELIVSNPIVGLYSKFQYDYNHFRILRQNADQFFLSLPVFFLFTSLNFIQGFSILIYVPYYFSLSREIANKI